MISECSKTVREVFITFKDLDHLINNRPSIFQKLTKEQTDQMGKFIGWAIPVVTHHPLQYNAVVEVPAELAWVIQWAREN